MRSTIVTKVRLAAGLLIGLIPAVPSGAAGADGVARLHADVAAISGARSLPTSHTLIAECGGDRICAAQRIADALGPRARLVRVDHPDTDTIRWVRNAPSVTCWSRTDFGETVIRLDRFGRKAIQELIAVRNLSAQALILDLRGNGGGDLERMLRVAGLFLGPVADAVTLHGRRGVAWLDLPAPQTQIPAPAAVLVGSGSASSAEVLAMLLRTHGRAPIWGQRTTGKDYLHRIVPVSHDWRLHVPAGTWKVAGISVSGGLVPDGPLPPRFTPCRRMPLATGETIVLE